MKSSYSICSISLGSERKLRCVGPRIGLKSGDSAIGYTTSNLKLTETGHDEHTLKLGITLLNGRT